MLEGGPLMATTRHNVKPRSECHRREESKVPKGPSLHVAVTRRCDGSGVEDEDRALQQGRVAGGIHW